MNFLSIDASSDNVSLCISRGEKIVADINRRMRFGASKLIEYIDKALLKNSLSLKSIDAFVVGRGPGSFTGLRISFSLIKAFMLATEKPAIAVGSFYACLYPFRERSPKVAVISDARRNLIYGACFNIAGGDIRIRGREKLFLLEEFMSKNKDYLFVTYNRALREKALERNPGISFYPADVYPKARYLLPLAKKCYNEGRFTPIERLEPLYLHPKTCQIRGKEAKK